MKLYGRTLLQVDGMNVEKFLHILMKHKIKLYSVDRVSINQFFLEIDTRSLPKLFGINKNMCYTIKVVSQTGLNVFIKHLLQRLAIPITAIVCIVGLSLSSLFVTKIEVLGVSDEYIVATQQYLAEHGYSKGTRISNVDCATLESELKQNFDNIALVSVAKKGTTIIVNIEERLNPVDLSPHALVARSEGVITKINLISGTPLVEVGDIVKEGQVLVAPYVYVKGERVAVNALAEVYATVEYTESTVFKEHDSELVRTGKSVTYNDLVIFGWMPFKNTRRPEYSKYEIELVDKQISSILPIKILSSVYYELELQPVDRDFDELREELISNTECKALAKLSEDSTVLSVDTYVSTSNGVYYITTYVKTDIRLDIGENNG